MQQCSNQADSHMTLVEPICPSDVLQRPSSIAVRLAADQEVMNMQKEVGVSSPCPPPNPP